MQTPDLPPPRPALVDTAERTATPGSLQPVYKQATVDPYQETILHQAKLLEADYFLFGDTNHRESDIWAFYFSKQNIDSMHAAGVKVMSGEMPAFFQILVDDLYKGKIDKTIFENILMAEITIGDINKLSIDNLVGRVKAISNGVEYAKALGIHIDCADFQSENIQDFYTFRNFKSLFYNSFKKILKVPVNTLMPTSDLIGLYHQTESYVRDSVLTSWGRKLLETSLKPLPPDLLDSFSNKTALPPSVATYLDERRKNDYLVADHLRELAKKYKGRVALLYGMAHMRNPNNPALDLKMSDIDNALIKRGEKVLTVAIVPTVTTQELGTRENRRFKAIETMSEVESLNGIFFLGRIMEIFFVQQRPQIATPPTQSVAASAKPQP